VKFTSTSNEPRTWTHCGRRQYLVKTEEPLVRHP